PGLVPADLVLRASAGEGAVAGEQVVERRPQAVDVGAGVGGVTVLRLLGRHKIGGPQRDVPVAAAEGVGLVGEEASQPQVEHLDRAGAIHQQVGRLDVAVYQPVFVGVS